MPKPDNIANLIEPARPSEPIAGSYQPALSEANARYAEYLRALDEVPVLLDVVSEPPRAAIRDFRLGQRPNVRKATREDAYVVRQLEADQLAGSYVEYSASQPADEGEDAGGAVRAGAKKKTKRSKSGKRAKRRKR